MYKMIPYTKVRTVNQPTSKSIHDSWLDKKLFTGSRSLYDQLQRNENLQKATIAKRKYINRSRYRATPFGLFSSVKLCEMSEVSNPKNQMIIQNDYKVYTSIDSEWIHKFISNTKSENLDKLAVYWNNNVIYQNSNYIYNTWTPDDKKKFSSNKIHVNNLIECIRDNSKNFLTLEELSEKLEKNNNIPLPNHILLSVVKQLVKGGYLITDIDNLTFVQNFELLIRYLKKKKYSFPEDTISKAKNMIKRLNCPVNDFNLDTVNELEELLSSIIVSKHYLRYDSETNVVNLDLDKKMIEESVLPLINFLSSYAIRVPLSERYQADVHFFKEKYGNAKVKFPEFYKNYQLVRENNRSLESKTSNLESKIRTQLLAFISTASKLNSIEIDISKLCFKKMKIEGEMPPTIQTCFHLGVENDKTSFSLTPYGGNNGLGRLEGRFSYINPEYFTMVKDIERNKHLEANTEIITVKYMPKEHHYYNIMNDCYEGNFNLQFGTAENHKSLSLENLFIGVQDNKLTFFSCLNGNEKIVKFEQYNVSNIEHFSPHVLNDLLFWSSNYYSNLMSLIFDIQKLRKDFIYFPRVHFKGLELFPQSWLIKNYLEDGLQKDEFFSKFDDMKKIYEIPDSFFIRTNDLRLLIDTNCEDDLDILWDIYKKDTHLDMYLEAESMDFSNSATIDSEGNHYISEFVFNFVSQKINPKKLNLQSPYHSKEELNLKRKVKWNHFNIYLPHEHHDDFLGAFLFEFINKLKDNGVVSKFFFIRYFDDRHHIRVRLSPSSKYENDLIDDYLAKGVIKGDIIDYSPGKYEPEYERYGGLSTISSAEDFFCADSSLILDLLHSCLENEKLDKVDHAIYLIFKILSIHTKEVYQQFLIMDDGYSNKDFAKNYRDNRKKYLTYSDLAASSDYNLTANYIVFNKDQLTFWEYELSNYFNKLKQENLFDFNIIRSLIHITCIRLFGIKSEEEELVGNMVWRVLKQKVALNKYNSDNLILN
ncbi:MULTISPECIES: lantibiotic dehydratase [Bacillus cereus group]|uniref:lantibiotic dehydratase n=1 Tax=Bacillus cereus group TaxID=86661 RepID=UPI000BEB8AB3|nr:lantibiotic dehydratase [Bacillus thuringiensis]PDY30024.1 hypothetical protein COM84_09150 [Bacillus thuringiensis]